MTGTTAAPPRTRASHRVIDPDSRVSLTWTAPPRARTLLSIVGRMHREPVRSPQCDREVGHDSACRAGGHFDSKEALVEAALDSAFAQFLKVLQEGEPEDAVSAYCSLYLSDDHKNHPGLGCPVAAVGPQVARMPESLKAAFGAGVKRIVAALARVMKGSAKAKEAAAFREFSMLAGAMVIARDSDGETSRAVLNACRRNPERVQRHKANQKA